jgi:uncharacterized protein (DUF169 family)
MPTAGLAALSKLNLANAPVAVAFLDAPPPGLERVDRPAPAGCAYWKRASEGVSFFTTAEDHQNCPIGAYTHGVQLTEAKGAELQSMLGTMIELKYIKADEVPRFPHRPEPMKVAAYAPLASAPFAADVVIFRGDVRQIMLLLEAAMAAGIFEPGSVMGRPACAMLPRSISGSTGVASVGCIGNRVYTGLGDNEMYLSIVGPDVPRLMTSLDAVLHANDELEKFHRQRAAALSALSTSA